MNLTRRRFLGLGLGAAAAVAIPAVRVAIAVVPAPIRDRLPAGVVHVDQVLTRLSLAYMSGMSKEVAPTMLPVVPVDRDSVTYYEFRRDDWWRVE